jgi:DNA-directed RNA polymerase specialized sigma24 family protein
MDENEPSQRQALLNWLAVKSNEARCRGALRKTAFKYATLRGLSVDDAVTEMYGEVVIRALERADQLISSDSPFPWLMRFASFIEMRWQADGLMEQKRLVRASDGVQDDNSQEQFERLLAAHLPSSQDSSSRVLDTMGVEQTLAALPAHHRETIVSFIEADLDTHLAAQRLGITPVAFRKRMERARAWFKANVAASPAELVAGGHQK